jgi:uncharacterized protein
MIYDIHYLLYVALPAFVLSAIAQGMVRSAYSRYSQIPARSGLTGAQAALEMLRGAGLERTIAIERAQGFLSDHYDPRGKVLRLSPDVHDGRSLASVGVACHEVGHAVQDAQHYAPLVIRNIAVPIAGFGSNLGGILVFIGLVLVGLVGALGLTIAWAGVLLFAAAVLFQIVNLPVEFDASARAKRMVAQLGIVQSQEESTGVSKVLNAAALTYVAATVGAILQLIYFVSLVTNNRR